jgi:uncharacterized protein YdeI (YjbR/CyaY-like superfamily)
VKLGRLLTVADRVAWRLWLSNHHRTEREIWLVYFKKDSGRKRIPYNDAVEEALCYGWIDSTLKKVDEKRYAQRFTPRKPGSQLSPMNRERVKRLITKRKMTRAGLAAIHHVFRGAPEHREPPIPPDILRALKRNKGVWKNFSAFPDSYKRIRVGWIDGSRNRPEFFRKRLNYFLRMTAKNKRFGMVQ